MSKVAIIGAGLAGLSAGITILEELPEAKVVIYNMGHHPGGRATSWRDAQGFAIDHGFHAIMHSYSEMRKLMKKAGIKEKEALISNQKKSLFYEEDTGKLHQFNNLFNFSSLGKAGVQYGYTKKENRQLAKFFLKNLNAIYLKKDIEQYDDVCFSRWLADNGMPENLIKKRLFRFTRDAYFNWPSEVSAYIILLTMRMMKNPLVYYVNGNYGEKIIAPLVALFEKLGGKLELTVKLESLRYDDQKITGISLGNPNPTPHDFGMKNWNREVPILPKTQRTLTDFDALIVAIPVDCFRELNPGEEVFWQHFSGIDNLSSVATLSWQLWLEKPVLPELPCAINGLDEPMGTVIDWKPLVEEYKNNERYGSVLQWVGQETGFEDHSDEELKEKILEGFLKIPGARDPRKVGVIQDEFRRNTSNYERFLLTDPGTTQFRPVSKTHFSNLFLAGDWIRNKVDVPTMEGAVVSGQEAAQHVVQQLK